MSKIKGWLILFLLILISPIVILIYWIELIGSGHETKSD